MNPTAAPRLAPTKPAGWIYLIHTWDDDRKYVGQTTTPVWQRINAHRKDKPWGREIRPGRDGYTILRRVESLGEPSLDAIALDLAEAEAIAEWHPSDNAHRPDPQVFRDRLALARIDPTAWASTPRRGVAPVARPTPGRTRPPAARPIPWRTFGFVILSAAWVVITARLTADATNPTTPWVAIPIAALLGPVATVGLYRKATRRTPRRRYRRRRRR